MSLLPSRIEIRFVIFPNQPLMKLRYYTYKTFRGFFAKFLWFYFEVILSAKPEQPPTKEASDE